MSDAMDGRSAARSDPAWAAARHGHAGARGTDTTVLSAVNRRTGRAASPSAHRPAHTIYTVSSLRTHPARAHASGEATRPHRAHPTAVPVRPVRWGAWPRAPGWG
eukprot:7161204-Prymnesium_polylepis.1